MRVAVLGTGLMGLAIAERLVSCGNQVIAYNRTKDKTLPLARLGVEVASTPAEAVFRSRYVLLLVSDAAAIRAAWREAGDLVRKIRVMPKGKFFLILRRHYRVQQIAHQVGRHRIAVAEQLYLSVLTNQGRHRYG